MVFVGKYQSSISFRWFHKNVLRKEAERLLLIPSNPRGTFLVRNSENAPGKSNRLLIYRYHSIRSRSLFFIRS